MQCLYIKTEEDGREYQILVSNEMHERAMTANITHNSPDCFESFNDYFLYDNIICLKDLLPWGDLESLTVEYLISLLPCYEKQRSFLSYHQYALTLLEEAQKESQEESKKDSQEESEKEAQDEGYAPDSSQSTQDAFRWTCEGIFTLLEQYKQREIEFYKTKNHKRIWFSISLAMRAVGLDVTSTQCMAKVNAMRKTFKHKKLGRSHKAKLWPFYKIMDDICSRPLKKSIKSRGSETSTELQKNELPLGTILQNMEQGRERRHREKMVLRKEILRAIEKLLDK